MAHSHRISTAKFDGASTGDVIYLTGRHDSRMRGVMV